MKSLRKAGDIRACAALLLFAAAFSTPTLSQFGRVAPESVPPSYDTLLDRAAAPGGIEILVTLDVDARSEALLGAADIVAQRDAIHAAQARLSDQLRDVNAKVLTANTLFPIVHMSVDRAALQRLLEIPGVKYIEENGFSLPRDSGSNAAINVAAAWAAGFDGTGWTVVIMDTGVQSSHPFLAGKLVDEVCFSSTNATVHTVTVCPNGQSTTIGAPGQAGAGSGVNCPSATAGCEHGTNVTGIAVGKNYVGGPGYDGVARGANYISVQVFSQATDSPATNPPNICTASFGAGQSPCSISFTSDQLAALQYVLSTFVPNPAYKIASIALGVGGATQAASCDSNSLKMPIDALRAGRNPDRDFGGQ